MAPKSCRNNCFTLNNWTEEEYDAIKGLIYSYLVIGKEIGAEGTKHLQGYIEFKNSTSFSMLKKKLPRAHWEKRRGSALEASNYCKKEGDFFEDGEISNQGARSDLVGLVQSVAGGSVSVDSLVLDNPEAFHQYGRTLARAEDIALRRRFRTEMTEGIWFFGPTGVGKSHRAFTNFDASTCYRWKDDNGWWDGYVGQETVIINEFRGGIPYATLLELVDRWPFEVRRRNREPAPFLAKRVIVTSSLPPEEVFHNLAQHDSLEQLYRRFKVFKCIDWTTEAPHTFGGSVTAEVPGGGNTMPPRIGNLSDDLRRALTFPS